MSRSMFKGFYYSLETFRKKPQGRKMLAVNIMTTREMKLLITLITIVINVLVQCILSIRSIGRITMSYVKVGAWMRTKRRGFPGTLKLFLLINFQVEGYKPAHRMFVIGLVIYQKKMIEASMRTMMGTPLAGIMETTLKQKKMILWLWDKFLN